LTLSGTNSYTGGTTVSAGTLLVNGSLTTSAVTVGSGGTLGGSGSLGALLTVQSGGVLSPGNSPGNSPGALAAAALDLQAGSTTFMQVIGSGAAAGVAGTDYDQIQITSSGGLTYGGILNLDFGSSPTFLNGTVFDLFAFSGASIGDFSSVFTTGTGLYAGYSLSGAGGIWTTTIGDQLISFSEPTGRLTISAVPEIDRAMGASTLSLVAGVLAIFEQRRRRS
jgi:autotransporter-associated beta strand protein